MLGDVNYDPMRPIGDYEEFTCDHTMSLLETSYGTKNVRLVEEGEDYILVEADAIFKAHGKKFMRQELNRLNLRWGYHYGKPEGYSNDVICIYTKEPDCPHCGQELEYQCSECEKEEKNIIDRYFPNKNSEGDENE